MEGVESGAWHIDVNGCRFGMAATVGSLGFGLFFGFDDATDSVSTN